MPDATLSDMGTSLIDCSRFCAVTMMVLSSPDSALADAASDAGPFSGAFAEATPPAKQADSPAMSNVCLEHFRTSLDRMHLSPIFDPPVFACMEHVNLPREAPWIGTGY
jgi:hypothetical protein